jgi:prepilin signal peptidase PulO-like enzyme (type II secretory pathway)
VDAVLTLVATLTLIAASLQDMKTMRVPHLYWLPLLSVGTLSLLSGVFNALAMPSNWAMGALMMLAINFFAGMVPVYVLRRRNGLGGADVMALFSLNIAYAATSFFGIIVLGCALVVNSIIAVIPVTRGKKMPFLPAISFGYVAAVILLW